MVAPGANADASRPWTPCSAPYTPTEAVKTASRTICPIAPLDGTHLPYRSGATPATVAPETKSPPKASIPSVERSVKNRSQTAIATIVTEPPSHTGVPAQ
jgi:hypothetical protein